MPEIFDNLTEHLGLNLRRTLDGSTGVDACVGYFNFRGWNEIAEAVGNLPFEPGAKPAMRLLIGMSSGEHGSLRAALNDGRFGRNTNEEAESLRLRTLEALREQLSFRVPSASDEKTLRTLRAQLEERRVQVRMHLAFNLHAKLYLCHLKDRTATDCRAFLGSSNLTFAGLQHQGELNIDAVDRDATGKLKTWFNDRWNDRLSIDANDLLINIIDQSWASEHPLSPYLIHLRLAHHFSRDAREGLIEYDVPEAIRSKLLEFQTAAVRITAKRIQVQGGAMIADVVGLGKTMMATGVALTLQERHGYETLVIAPRNLVEMWEEYRAEYRWHGRVISRTMVHRELPDLRRYRFVIIDESHHLRTRHRRDYRAIRDYVSKNEPKVLLLTATPFNRSMDDVANQLGLFLSDDTPLPLRPEAELRKQGEYDFKTRYQLDNLYSLSAMRRSEQVQDWQKLLSLFVIRRTRGFIEENYAEQDEQGRSYLDLGNGNGRFHLPRRMPRRLEWKAKPGDPAVELESDAVLDLLNSLSLPRYRLQEFIKPDMAPTPAEEEILKGWSESGRGNLTGITRSMLYKRLSSGGYAFVLSVRRHLLNNHVYLRGLEQDGVIPVGTYDLPEGDEAVDEGLWIDQGSLEPSLPVPDWTALADETLTKLRNNTPSTATLLRAKLFTGELRERILEDNAKLLEVLARVPTWEATRDGKLRSLFELLGQSHGEEKVLVFSEFSDTARYLYRELKNLQLQGGLGLITGSHVESDTVSSGSVSSVVRSFSPKTAGAPGVSTKTERELRVMVATDVLSEGLNLQDCSIVVNFDLPWAIIKLIQRAGRVDRIGQEAEEVTVYSVCPTEGVEAVIDLRGRIRRRLAESAQVFGSDERFFGDKEEEHQVRSFFDETSALHGLDEEEVDYTSMAYEIWREAEQRQPALAHRAANLPLQAHATRARGGSEQGILACTTSSSQVDQVFFQPTHGEMRAVTPLDALTFSACSLDTPGLPRQEDHFDTVEEITKVARKQSTVRTAGSLAGIRKRAYDRLRALTERNENTLFAPTDDDLAAVNAIYAHPLSELANQTLSRLLRGGAGSDEEIMKTVSELYQDDNLVVQRTPDNNRTDLLCSLGLV